MIQFLKDAQKLSVKELRKKYGQRFYIYVYSGYVMYDGNKVEITEKGRRALERADKGGGG